MRIIDADAMCEALLTRWHTADKNAKKIIKEVMADVVVPIVVSQPTIETKEIKYYDEDDSVWKIGRVIVDERTDNNKATQRAD